MKKILILGGTMFVGRSLTERLIASGNYDVTLFNRGKSNTDLFKEVNQIHGDRETADIEKIYGQHWDCIIDFSGYYPTTFGQLLNGLKGKVGRYIFISTISVYDLDKYQGHVIVENCDTLKCSDAQKISQLWDAYGEKKAEMERLLLQHTELDKIIFRPSYIYGKYDWTERFYYWLYRIQNCAKFLLPDEGKPKQISLTNADDLTEALLQAIEIKRHSTIYNTISTPSISIRKLLGIAATAYGKNPEIITANASDLEKLSLQPSQFPLVSPLGFNVDDALWRKDFSFTRADLAATLIDMRDYNAAEGFPKPAAGLDIEKEHGVIGNGLIQ
jgi:2'-hydroxyisoflavone reductase